MWTISGLKEEAKIQLNKQYWITVLTCIIISFIISFNLSGIKNTINNNNNSAWNKIDYENIHSFSDFMDEYSDVALQASSEGLLLAASSLIDIIIFIINTCYKVFVANVMVVGASIFFLSFRLRNTKLETIFYGFNGNYKNVVLTMFMKNLFVSLWSLLFIIPGIIKGYEYRMVPYLLAENPNMPYKRALELSSKMMDGEKLNAWILDLSFIGWHILNMFTCGILGIFYLTPYIYHTNAGLYIALRSKAISNGYSSEEELGCVVNANDLEKPVL